MLLCNTTSLICSQIVRCLPSTTPSDCFVAVASLQSSSGHINSHKLTLATPRRQQTVERCCHQQTQSNTGIFKSIQFYPLYTERYYLYYRWLKICAKMKQLFRNRFDIIIGKYNYITNTFVRKSKKKDIVKNKIWVEKATSMQLNSKTALGSRYCSDIALVSSIVKRDLNPELRLNTKL